MVHALLPCMLSDLRALSLPNWEEGEIPLHGTMNMSQWLSHPASATLLYHTNPYTVSGKISSTKCLSYWDAAFQYPPPSVY